MSPVSYSRKAWFTESTLCLFQRTAISPPNLFSPFFQLLSAQAEDLCGSPFDFDHGEGLLEDKRTGERVRTIFIFHTPPCSLLNTCTAFKNMKPIFWKWPSTQLFPCLGDQFFHLSIWIGAAMRLQILGKGCCTLLEASWKKKKNKPANLPSQCFVTLRCSRSELRVPHPFPLELQLI